MYEQDIMLGENMQIFSVLPDKRKDENNNGIHQINFWQVRKEYC